MAKTTIHRMSSTARGRVVDSESRVDEWNNLAISPAKKLSLAREVKDNKKQ